ncbi:hypothetical protein CsSME_00027083 [Camellia sinensis var. sinensis]
MQLCQEKEECKRITSKIKKFVKAHNRYSRLQDELKRSHDRLQKLGDHLGSDAARLGATEDSSINILSDGEPAGNHAMSPPNQLQKNVSPNKKRLQVNVEAAEESKSANLMKGEGTMMGTIRLQKNSRWNMQHFQYNNNKEAEIEDNGNNNRRTLANEDMPKRGKNLFTNVSSAEKMKYPTWLRCKMARSPWPWVGLACLGSGLTQPEPLGMGHHFAPQPGPVHQPA